MISIKSGLLLRTRRSAAHKQRGAVLVEAAIALPMVTLLLFGILEYGLMFGDAMKLAGALRAGARAGAAMDVADSSSDYLILQSVKAAAGQVAPSIFRVVIYKSSSANGEVPAECKAGTPIAGLCNVYTQEDLNLNEAGLDASGHSNPWYPSTRIPGTDFIGVWAGADHHWVTGILGDSRTVGDQAVMRVQPLPNSGAASDSGYWPDPIATTIPTTTTTEPPPDDPSGDTSGDTGDGGSGDGGSSGDPDPGPTTTAPRRAPDASPAF